MERNGAITSPTTPACAEWDLTPVADSEETHVFDRVVLACGVNTRPSMATWPGMDCFEGTIRHTVGYKNAEPYAGKRVLLVGLGESGSDIALQVAAKAAATAVSSALLRDSPGGAPCVCVPDTSIQDFLALASKAKQDVTSKDDINGYSSGVPVLYNKFLFRAG